MCGDQVSGELWRQAVRIEAIFQAIVAGIEWRVSELFENEYGRK